MSADPSESCEPCERLPWDSAFFGIPIARVRAHRLDDVLAEAIETWAAAAQIRCLYFLADPSDAVTRRIADARHFRQVDTRVTYHLARDGINRLVEADRLAQVRVATQDDVPALRAMAAVSFRESGTRFYNDLHFPRVRCDELYATWIEQSVRGWADRVLVLGPPGNPCGFITCHRDGHIGLAAVHPDHRGRGHGLTLYQAAIDWLAAEGIEPIVFVTQYENLRSRQLIQRLGGRSIDTAIWYHLWR